MRLHSAASGSSAPSVIDNKEDARKQWKKEGATASEISDLIAGANLRSKSPSGSTGASGSGPRRTRSGSGPRSRSQSIDPSQFKPAASTSANSSSGSGSATLGSSDSEPGHSDHIVSIGKAPSRTKSGRGSKSPSLSRGGSRKAVPGQLDPELMDLLTRRRAAEIDEAMEERFFEEAEAAAEKAAIAERLRAAGIQVQPPGGWFGFRALPSLSGLMGRLTGRGRKKQGQDQHAESRPNLPRKPKKLQKDIANDDLTHMRAARHPLGHTGGGGTKLRRTPANNIPLSIGAHPPGPSHSWGPREGLLLHEMLEMQRRRKRARKSAGKGRRGGGKKAAGRKKAKPARK